ncbi:single-stranded DNA-binding protein [Bifidobacterium sp. ESL0790]|uniref:single-stranded DNA-binding protein n=1 Tax=Bifidobacterium sp. ESL0790 TaxID=2983233 RepID=UPI0023F96138|nr:single-stranded DNA-binding protein [Bifidobacterium sp. ESL0790]WEV71966.1 single-stranded DNA-binding protein [Bifidobacterium sp. ESL0790]
MAQQGVVTISGFVGADPQSFGKEGGPAACSFRIGCTPRYFNVTANEWRDRPTTWLTVKAFRMLAVNVLSSVHKGDPVVATGNLVTEEWTRDGTTHTKMVMEATSVGHDLSFGMSVFQRVKPGEKGAGGANGQGGQAKELSGQDANASGQVGNGSSASLAANSDQGATHETVGVGAKDGVGLDGSEGAGDDPWDGSPVLGPQEESAQRQPVSVG